MTQKSAWALGICSGPNLAQPAYLAAKRATYKRAAGSSLYLLLTVPLETNYLKM